MSTLLVGKSSPTNGSTTVCGRISRPAPCFQCAKILRGALGNRRLRQRAPASVGTDSHRRGDSSCRLQQLSSLHGLSSFLLVLSKMSTSMCSQACVRALCPSTVERLREGPSWWLRPLSMLRALEWGECGVFELLVGTTLRETG
jgi:hypothetical protein